MSCDYGIVESRFLQHFRSEGECFARGINEGRLLLSECSRHAVFHMAFLILKQMNGYFPEINRFFSRIEKHS
jgi:hypothetical protein